MPGSVTQLTFGAEMFPRNQCSNPTFRKNAEHYIAYSALNAHDYLDNISCISCVNIFKLRFIKNVCNQ